MANHDNLEGNSDKVTTVSYFAMDIRSLVKRIIYNALFPALSPQ
jgi:hypothetical protein